MLGITHGSLKSAFNHFTLCKTHRNEAKFWNPAWEFGFYDKTRFDLEDVKKQNIEQKSAISIPEVKLVSGQKKPKSAFLKVIANIIQKEKLKFGNIESKQMYTEVYDHYKVLEKKNEAKIKKNKKIQQDMLTNLTLNAAVTIFSRPPVKSPPMVEVDKPPCPPAKLSLSQKIQFGKLPPVPTIEKKQSIDVSLFKEENLSKKRNLQSDNNNLQKRQKKISLKKHTCSSWQNIMCPFYCLGCTCLLIIA